MKVTKRVVINSSVLGRKLSSKEPCNPVLRQYFCNRDIEVLPLGKPGKPIQRKEMCNV